MALNIAILLDSLKVSQWQLEIIKFIRESPNLTVQLVVLNNEKAKSKKNHRVVYKVGMKLDRTLFKVKHDAFKIIDAAPSLAQVDKMEMVPNAGKYYTEFNADDIDIINSKSLDVIIRFGFGILNGDILSAAKHGVWSLHHGDNAVNRGGPPAFWEIVNREDVTGVTLQKLTSDLDGGVVINKAFAKTDLTSFNRNQNSIFWVGVELFCSTLNQLAEAGTLNVEASPLAFYSMPLYKDPSNSKALKIFTKFWWRRIGEFFNSIAKKQQWILLYKLRKQGFETSLFRYKKLKPKNGADWADPFIIYRDEKHYLFFEELIKKNKKAHISCLVFDQAGKLTSEEPIKVLAEAHHLSYPFIFNHENQYYMIPEAGDSKSLWLYRCEHFPDQWVKHHELIENIGLYDPTLFFHKGLWYLFGTQKPLTASSADQHLYIYYAHNLEGDWTPHVQNPVSRDVRGARPAGKIFEYEGKIIRPAQIGAPKYGYGILFNEIITLTPEEFVEQPIQKIEPHWRNGMLATHTFNNCQGFSVVDAQER